MLVRFAAVVAVTCTLMQPSTAEGPSPWPWSTDPTAVCKACVQQPNTVYCGSLGPTGSCLPGDSDDGPFNTFCEIDAFNGGWVASESDCDNIGCAQHKDCVSCAKVGGCGWCPSTQECSYSYRPGTWVGYYPTTCPWSMDGYVTPEGGAALIFNPDVCAGVPCTQFHTCRSCTAIAFCGWCDSSQKCLLQDPVLGSLDWNYSPFGAVCPAKNGKPSWYQNSGSCPDTASDNGSDESEVLEETSTKTRVPFKATLRPQPTRETGVNASQDAAATACTETSCSACLADASNNCVWCPFANKCMVSNTDTCPKSIAGGPVVTDAASCMPLCSSATSCSACTSLKLAGGSQAPCSWCSTLQTCAYQWDGHFTGLGGIYGFYCPQTWDVDSAGVSTNTCDNEPLTKLKTCIDCVSAQVPTDLEWGWCNSIGACIDPFWSACPEGSSGTEANWVGHGDVTRCKSLPAPGRFEQRGKTCGSAIEDISPGRGLMGTRPTAGFVSDPCSNKEFFQGGWFRVRAVSDGFLSLAVCTASNYPAKIVASAFSGTCATFTCQSGSTMWRSPEFTPSMCDNMHETLEWPVKMDEYYWILINTVSSYNPLSVGLNLTSKCAKTGHFLPDCSQCAPDWAGATCTIHCPQCDSHSEGCDDGKRGTGKCICSSCHGHGTCNNETGLCICNGGDQKHWLPDCSDCSDPYFGGDCAGTCPHCDPSSHGCDRGLHGSGVCKCASLCSGQPCDNSTGTCVCNHGVGEWLSDCSDCKDGHYGAGCDKVCPPCATGSTCSQGVHGDGSCECSTTCLSHGECNTAKGTCRCLQNGFWGAQCQHNGVAEGRGVDTAIGCCLAVWLLGCVFVIFRTAPAAEQFQQPQPAFRMNMGNTIAVQAELFSFLQILYFAFSATIPWHHSASWLSHLSALVLALVRVDLLVRLSVACGFGCLSALFFLPFFKLRKTRHPAKDHRGHYAAINTDPEEIVHGTYAQSLGICMAPFPVVFAFTMLLTIPLIRTLLLGLQCVYNQAGTRPFLQEAPDVTCWTSAHGKYIALAISGLLMSMPIVLGVVPICDSSRKLNPNKDIFFHWQFLVIKMAGGMVLCAVDVFLTRSVLAYAVTVALVQGILLLINLVIMPSIGSASERINTWHSVAYGCCFSGGIGAVLAAHFGRTSTAPVLTFGFGVLVSVALGIGGEMGWLQPRRILVHNVSQRLHLGQEYGVQERGEVLSHLQAR